MNIIIGSRVEINICWNGLHFCILRIIFCPKGHSTLVQCFFAFLNAYNDEPIENWHKDLSEHNVNNDLSVLLKPFLCEVRVLTVEIIFQEFKIGTQKCNVHTLIEQWNKRQNTFNSDGFCSYWFWAQSLNGVDY